jgi:hypothetical protein
MSNVSTPWGALVLTDMPVSELTIGQVVAAVNGGTTSREFNPGQFVGYFNASGPQTGDAASLWLPTVADAAQFAWQTAGGPVTVRLSAPHAVGRYYTSPLACVLAPSL